MNKGNGFLKVLGISEIANQIIRYLMPSARDIAAMGATCRDACVLTAMNMVSITLSCPYAAFKTEY